MIIHQLGYPVLIGTENYIRATPRRRRPSLRPRAPCRPPSGRHPCGLRPCGPNTEFYPPSLLSLDKPLTGAKILKELAFEKYHKTADGAWLLAFSLP